MGSNWESEIITMNQCKLLNNCPRISKLSQNHSRDSQRIRIIDDYQELLRITDNHSWMADIHQNQQESLTNCSRINENYWELFNKCWESLKFTQNCSGIMRTTKQNQGELVWDWESLRIVWELLRITKSYLGIT